MYTYHSKGCRFLRMASDPNEVLTAVMGALQGSQDELTVSTTLAWIDENAGFIIQSTDTLFELLTVVQNLIDSSPRRPTDSRDRILSDTVKSHALTTYTCLIVDFDVLAEPIRPQFIKALADMIGRRNVKRRDYVNSYMRGVACECLNELELAFPGQVSQCLKLDSWLESEGSGTPLIVDAVQEEQLVSFENYVKLFLTCCSNHREPINHKAMMKTMSLVLDSVDNCSPWLRLHTVALLPDLVGRMSSQQSWTWAVVHHHFSRLLDACQPHQVHAFWTVAKPFVAEWDSDFADRFVDRLFSIPADLTIHVPVKQLSVYWLCSLLSVPELRDRVYRRRSLLMPDSSDSAQLAEVKLQALLRFCLAFRSVPKQILLCVSPMTRWEDSRDGVEVVFRFIVRVLLTLSEQLEDEFFKIPQFINELLSSTTRLDVYMPSVIATLTILSRTTSQHRPGLVALLTSLGSYLCAVQPPSRTLAYFPLIAYLSCHDLMNPSVVIAAVTRFLQSSEDVSWTDGLKVIEICRLLMLHQEGVKAEIASLLSTVESAGSVDIRDRSRLYTRFLTGLDEDTRRIFLMAADLDKTNEIKAITMSAVLEQGDYHHDNLMSQIEFKKNYNNRRDQLKIFDDNWAVFDSSGERTPYLLLPFTLRFASHSAIEDGDTFPTNLYGIELSFSTSDNFHPFQAVHIPFLAVAAASHQSGDTDVFPFKYDVVLRLSSVSPQPTVFRVQMVFTDEAGNCHRGELESFTVTFEDLFMPVPEPVAEWSSVWTLVWKDPFAKLLPVGREVIQNLIDQRLSHFVISLQGIDPVPAFDFHQESLLYTSQSICGDPEITECGIIIFIPPSFHLTLRFVMGSHSTVVWIATDRPELLLLLDEFFDTLVRHGSLTPEPVVVDVHSELVSV